MLRIRWPLVVGIVVASTLSARAEAPKPPPPKEYQVKLRYRILAGRNERVPQFFALIRYLESIGFRKDPGPENEPEDRDLDRMTGTIAPERARLLLRNPYIKSLLLIPASFELPAEPGQPVKVQFELAGGFDLDRQKVLAEQVRQKLRLMGFREAVGYDHKGYTRLVGLLPVGELENVLKDLRWQPAGWLLPQQPFGELPSPLKNVSPILVTEVIPEAEAIPAVKDQTPPEPQKGQEKLGLDLRELLAMEGEAAKTRRLEVILNAVPQDNSWREQLTDNAAGIMLEGRMGQLVTLQANGEQVSALAQLPLVSSIRLPVSGAPQLNPVEPFREGNRSLLEVSGLDRLHKLGHVGRGVRLAIVDSDFRGWQALVGKSLPMNTRYIDLTSERNSTILPDPFPGEPKDLGLGTQCALAAAVAAPGCDLVLVRVDPAAPYHLHAVARAINGQRVQSFALDQRRTELEQDSDRLTTRRQQLLVRRQFVLDNFRQDEESLKRKEEYFQQQAEFDKEEKEYRNRLDRYVRLLDDLRELRDVRAVASTLVWNTGHPTDGSSFLSRYLDDNPFRSAFWFQSAGNTRGQAWAGLFRDRDGNGLMEFASSAALPAESRLNTADAALKPGRWTPELNFLAWQTFDGKQAAALPEKAKVRIAIQWREAHDPEFYAAPDDPYRTPLTYLRLFVLRQRDPSGIKVPGDEMEVVARSVGLPHRLLHLPSSSTYEQMVEFTVQATGHYALQIEGVVPEGIRPPGVPTLRAKGGAPSFEVRPRVFVEVIDDASRAAGRPIFLDYATPEGSVGMPGDAYHAVVVGASGPAFPEPYSADGPPWNLGLLARPTVRAYDRLQLGPAKAGPQDPTGAAAAFAAGLTTTAFSAGMPRTYFWRNITNPPGRILHVPDGWPGR